MIRTTPGKGKETYLLTRESFSDFELSFEWKAEAGANSGVKYRFQAYWLGIGEQVASEPAGPGRIEPIALEYQIADDEKNSDAVSDPKHATAAIYEYLRCTETWSGACRHLARGPHSRKRIAHRALARRSEGGRRTHRLARDAAGISEQPTPQIIPHPC